MAFCVSCLLLPIAKTDVAPIVDPERRLDEDVFSHMSHQLFQLDKSVCSNSVEVRIGILWEGVVVFVAPAAGLEAGCVELRRECFVTVADRESASRLE